MECVERWIGRASTAAAYLAGAILFGMTAFIMTEIVLRTFFDSSTFVMDEFVGYGLAAATFLGLGHTLRDGGLIRMQLLLGHLKAGWRRLAELFAVVSTLGLALYMAYYFWLSVSRNFERGSISASIAEVPLWIPEALLLAGLVLFIVQLVAYLARLFAPGTPTYLDGDAE